MPENSRFPKISCCQLPRLMPVIMMTILGLALLYLTACQPAAPTLPDPAFVPPTATQPTPEPPPPTFTPIPPPTETPLPTLAPPTILPTLRPADTPTPKPVWHIFFSGAPCITKGTCDSNLFMETDGGDYTVNSDGTGFMPVADLPGMPTNINFVQFSPDGSQMAYIQYQDDTHTTRVIRLLNLDGSSPIELGIQPPDWADIQFLPEQDCLAIFRRAGREDPPPEAETLTIEKWCVNQPPQLLEVVQFPELVPGSGYTWGNFKLSPNGNHLYGYGINRTNNVVLYLHKMGEITAPTLVTTLPPKQPAYLGPSRWWSDNATIEFTLFTSEPPAFYTSNWEQGKTNIRLTTDNASMTGIWSPDGTEFVYAYRGVAVKPAQSGLYIIDLESGEHRHLLDKFYATTVRTWDPTQLPNFLGDNNEKQ